MKPITEGFFFFSEKQKATSNSLGYIERMFCQLDNGRIVEYTEMNYDETPFSRWDDFVQLGHGRYHHTE